MCNRNRTLPRARRGYLLLAILPLAVLVGGFVLLSTTSARAYLEEHEARRHQVSALNEANAALAVAEARIRAAGYTENRNNEIHDAIENGATTTFSNAEDNPIRVLLVRDRSEVWISQLADQWFQLDAVASVGGKRAHVRSLVRERDPFTRFGSFVNSHPIGIGGSPKGDIHTNRVLQLFYEDGYYEDMISARDGFQWMVGASEENTTFAGGYDDSHPEIEMPDIATIESLEQFDDGALQALIGANNPNDFNISVELKGTTFDLRAEEKDPESGPPQIYVSSENPFPPSGVLFIGTDIASLQGELDTKVTLACTGEITLTGSIRYVDSNGEPIYLNGLSTDPDNEPYVPNPAYEGSAALGVIANGDILYDSDIADYVEMNGFFFSATGRFGLPGLTFTSDGRYCTGYDSSFQKQSYRRLGGIATDLRIVSTVVNSSGTVLSGFQHAHSVYDRRLRAEPPPHFLAIDRPVFNAYRVVAGGAAGTGSGEADGFNLTSIPIGSYEKAQP